VSPCALAIIDSSLPVLEVHRKEAVLRAVINNHPRNEVILRDQFDVNRKEKEVVDKLKTHRMLKKEQLIACFIILYREPHIQ